MPASHPAALSLANWATSLPPDQSSALWKAWGTGDSPPTAVARFIRGCSALWAACPLPVWCTHNSCLGRTKMQSHRQERVTWPVQITLPSPLAQRNNASYGARIRALGPSTRISPRNYLMALFLPFPLFFHTVCPAASQNGNNGSDSVSPRPSQHLAECLSLPTPRSFPGTALRARLFSSGRRAPRASHPPCWIRTRTIRVVLWPLACFSSSCFLSLFGFFASLTKAEPVFASLILSLSLAPWRTSQFASRP